MTIWQNVFADWATDRGHSVTAATMMVLGTPEYVHARKMFDDGHSVAEVRQLLDKAYREK